MKYGDKRNYPKIDIFVNNGYITSTTWAKTCKEAVKMFLKTTSFDKPVKVTAFFDRSRS